MRVTSCVKCSLDAFRDRLPRFKCSLNALWKHFSIEMLFRKNVSGKVTMKGIKGRGDDERY